MSYRRHPLSSVIALHFTLLALCGSAFGQSVEGLPAGIDPGAELILDALRVARGGDSTGNAFIGKLSLTLDYDSEVAGRRKGTHGRLNVLGTFGDSFSELAGDLQVASNIEAGDDLRIFEAWIEQSIGSRASILVGYSDFNAEFDVAETAAGLLNSSFGVGLDVSQAGPSIFPRSYPGLRLRVAGTSGMYAIAGGWKDVPFPEPDAVSGRELDGTFGAVEGGWTRESFGPVGSPKLAVGVWRFEAHGSRDHNDAIGGVYALAEGVHQLSGGRTVGGFIRAGRALEGSGPVREYVGAGVRLEAIVRSRPDDELAFGIARASLSREMSARMGTSAETTVELNWKFQLTERMAIVPDVQFVMAPAGGRHVRDALLFGVRTVLTLD